MVRNLSVILAAFCLTSETGAQTAPHNPDANSAVPNLVALVGTTSELAPVVNRYSNDLTSVSRRYDADGSPDQRKRMRDFYTSWRTRLAEIDFDKLSHEGKIDYVLLNRDMKHELTLLDRSEKHRGEMASLIPFADRLLALQDSRRDLVTMNSRAASSTIASIAKEVDSLRALIESPPADTKKGAKPAPRPSRTVANRAARRIDDIKRGTAAWYKYYDGYDPQFSWWVKDPYKKLDDALAKYAKVLREKIVGFKPGEGTANNGPIVGDPIGRQGLDEELAYEMIPYTPEELIAIAQREYAFSLSEIKKRRYKPLCVCVLHPRRQCC